MAHPDTRPISFTYLPVASMWVLNLHSLFLYSDPHLPCHPPSYWLRLFSSQTFPRINTPTFLKPNHSSNLPAYEDGTVCSETSAYKIQTPGNYPERSIQQLLSKSDESGKCRIYVNYFGLISILYSYVNTQHFEGSPEEYYRAVPRILYKNFFPFSSVN